MALTSRRTIALLAAAAALIALLVYLRDPPWLIDVTSGLSEWRTDPSGVRYRTMGGRGSFFVRADAPAVTFPVRAPFDSPVDWPIAVTFFVDDTPVNRLVLTDESWRAVTIEFRRRPRRRVRRIDILADRTRAWNYALDVGAAEVR